MPPKAKAAAKAAVAPGGVMRRGNGRAVHRNLWSVRSKPVFLRRIDRQYLAGSLVAKNSMIVSWAMAGRIAEWLMRRGAAAQGRYMHLLAIYRHRSLVRIIHCYGEQRLFALASIQRSVNQHPATRPLVVSPEGVVMG
jgi:hypothetical protein